jgi:RNA polymerase sigma-70 factor (ECF subfamily)
LKYYRVNFGSYAVPQVSTVTGQPYTQVTQLLQQWHEGDQEALEALMPLVYNELKRLAGSYLRRERPDHTLQSAALVNEAYLRLVDQTQTRWQNKAHFYGIAAQMMRRILADHARGHNAAKRGAGIPELELDETIVQAQSRNIDVLDLEEALQKLEKLDPQQGKIVELRFFSGLSIEDTANVLSISPATVKRDWAAARAWLFREVGARHSVES